MLYRGPMGGGAASGAVGSVVASHNRGGQYLRARVTPTNPNTPRQAAIRAALGGAIQQWTQGLTGAQRDGWRLYAQNTPTTNRLGDTIHLTGQNMWVRQAAIIRQFQTSGLTGAAGPNPVAPTIFNTGEPVSGISNATQQPNIITVSGGNATFTVQFGSPLSAAGTTLLYVGAAQNKNRAFYKGPYQLASQTGFASGLNTNAFAIQLSQPTQYCSSYPMVPNSYVPIRLINVFADGRVSEPFEVITSVR